MNRLYFSKLKVVICTLTDGDSIVDAELDKELGEVLSVSASFALNSIPTLQAALPLGTSLMSGGKAEGSYVYREDIQKAFTERKPVGVFLESSDALPGVPHGRVWLFKGYITNASASFSTGAGSLQLTLTHWLLDLDVLAVLNRLSSPDNGADMSQNSMFFSVENEGMDRVASRRVQSPNWIVSNAIIEAFQKNPTDIFAAIKTGLMPILQEAADLKKDAVGKLPEHSIARLRSAVEAMQSKYLAFWDPISPKNDTEFLQAICKTFSAQKAADYYSVTLWKKLLQMLTAYYICVSPTVTEANVIPAPGMRIAENKAFKLPASRISGLRTHKTGKSLLGGVILMDSTRTTILNLRPTNSKQATYYMYPQTPEPGYIKTCFLPPWLTQVMIQKSAYITNQRSYFYHEDAAQQLQNARKSNNKAGGGKSALCDAYVKSVYLSEITREHTASLTMPLNLDLVPGDVVKVEVPRDRVQDLRQEYLYATIASVNYTISGGTASSSYTLTNLRDEALMKKFESPHALLYADGWRDNDDTDTRLYAKMED